MLWLIPVVILFAGVVGAALVRPRNRSLILAPAIVMATIAVGHLLVKLVIG
jgi:hypothetical protein